MDSQTAKTTQPRKERNYAVDFLRILAMLMICGLHVVKQGGVLDRLTPNTFGYWAGWLVRILCISSVNLYALISGYVGVRSNHASRKNVWKHWATVFFYSFGITVVYCLVTKTVSLKLLVKSVFPVISNQYWYFSAFFALSFLMPLLDKIVVELGKKKAYAGIVGIFLVLSCLGTASAVFGTDSFNLAFGYSFLWLTALYYIGAVLSEYGFPSSIKYGWLFAAATALTLLSKFLLEKVFALVGSSAQGNQFIMYISPFTLIAAISLLCAFSDKKMPKWAVPIISFLSPLTFGVYLIHVHPIVFDHLLKDRFVWIAERSPLLILLLCFAFAIVIFLVCTVIEFLRTQLFKLIRVNKAVEYLYHGCCRTISQLSEKIKFNT